jgi:hypothetical protein
MAGDGTNNGEDGTSVDQDDYPIIGTSSADGGIPTIDPASLGGENSAQGTGSNTRRRGRPRGSRNGGTKQATKEVASDLTGLLYSTHFMLAKIIKVPEIKLDNEEAEELGKALARVNKEFGIAVLSPKTAALVNLAIVAGTVYVPRLMAHDLRKKNEKKNGKQSSKPIEVDAEWTMTGQPN